MKRTLIALTVVVTLLTSQTPAEAHIKKWPSTITLNIPDSQDDFVNGTITGKDKCKERTIRVFKNGASEPDGETSTLLANSFWKATVNSDIVDGDKFIAKVVKKVVKKGALHRHVCKPAVSAEMTAETDP